MIRRYRHIIVSLLVCNLLIANVGVSMNWMYCYCKGQMQTSLFDISDDCEKEVGNHVSCCKTKSCDKQEDTPNQKSCCSKFAKYKKTVEKPCTSKGKKYLKADLKFFLSEKENKKSQYIDFQSFIPCVYFQNDEENTFESQILSSQPTHAPPPRFYGRSLLNLIQNYRC